jgi:hypothetical protein
LATVGRKFSSFYPKPKVLGLFQNKSTERKITLGKKINLEDKIRPSTSKLILLYLNDFIR